MPQNEQILTHLKEHGTITSRQAMFELGCGRLASRVHELREAGYPIGGMMIYTRKADGSPTKYKLYFLEAQNG